MCIRDRLKVIEVETQEATQEQADAWLRRVLLLEKFYRRNYIEGLFLSSAVLGTPDYTCLLYTSV